MFTTINNRELAVYVWISVFIIFCLSKASIRKHVPGLLKLLFSKSISTMIFLMIAYVVTVVFALFKVDFWDISLLKDTVMWLVGVGFIMLMNAHKAIKDNYHFKEIFKENIKLFIIVEFLINLYVFSLPVELLLVPGATFLVLLKFVSKMDEKLLIVTKFIDSLLSILGSIMIIYVTYNVIADFKNFATISNLRSFLSPVFLTLAYIPFIYAMALFIIYEEFFVRINMAFRHDEPLRKYVKRKVFENGKFNLSKVRMMTKELHIFNIDSHNKFDEAIAKINF